MIMEIYLDDGGLILPGQVEMLTRVVLAAAQYVAGVDATEVSVSFVDEDGIRRLNREFRGLDSVTDVLSFPAALGVHGDVRPLGDVVVCVAVARRQAEEYGHSMDRELAFLVAHGILHLLGFGHDDADSEAKMCRVQDEILLSLGMGRG